jgi:hypothetical protein
VYESTVPASPYPTGTMFVNTKVRSLGMVGKVGLPIKSWGAKSPNVEAIPVLIDRHSVDRRVVD